MAELLLELLCEEIPARMQVRAAEELRGLVTGKLKEAGLAYTQARAYATPRRLVLVVDGLPKKQPDVTEEKKGPKVGAPEQALQGFIKANRLGTLEQAEVRATDRGEFYFVVRHVKGRATAEVLPRLVEQAIQGLSWPRSMRWGSGDFRWVRPLHAILAVFAGKAFDGRLRTEGGADVVFGERTVGHRFLAPEPFAVSCFADYRDKLHKVYVVLDHDERKRIIAEEAAKIAASEGLRVKDDPALLDEVAGLVEWPVALIGTIDEAFMDLPPEVLTTEMRHHQKYFSTLDEAGQLADRFLAVANMPAPKNSTIAKNIVAGNERVLRARLADARFFWDQDRKQRLAERVPALEGVVFQARLGSLAEKVSRMQALAVEISEHIPDADRDRVRSAARLAKADLVTGMVGEFPELQGVMGRYYALNDQEHTEVAEAIAEHYSPLGPNDRCPNAPVSVAVALADKIDSLVGMFAIGETPTGSKDPYALRRAALGVIRLIVENRLRLPLGRVFQLAQQTYRGLDGDPAEASLLEFFAERLKVALREKGVRHDLISAVFALGGEDDLVRLLDRVRALEHFLGSEDGANLLTAYRRAANIVRIESRKDKTAYNGGADAGRFVQDEEGALYQSLGEAAASAGPALAREDFTGAMAALARLRRPVDDFFDRVTVNAENAELRENRLRLLAQIGATLGRVADFSKIED
jgi:glycyl-tRNA synthetase beta chain